MINVRRIDKQFRTCRSGRKSWWDAASFVYLSWSGWPELMDLFIRDDVVCLFIIDHDLAWIPWSIHVTYVQNKFWKVAFGRLQYSTRGLIRKIWLLGICLWPASSRRGCYFLLRQKVTKNRCRQNGPSYSCLAYHSSRLTIWCMPTSGPGRLQSGSRQNRLGPAARIWSVDVIIFNMHGKSTIVIFRILCPIK